MDSEEEQHRLYKKTLLIVIISQIFGGAGLAAGITVGALLAQDMMGTDSVTGLPTAVFTFGSAGAALLVGRLSQRLGRRTGLAAGFLTGGMGAVGVVLAAITNHIGLLFVALLIYGAGTATNLQARYAGTDLASSTQRAKAVSMAMISTTLGAVAGPNLVGPMGEVATAMGIPSLAGPFLLAAAAYLAAGAFLYLFLRPDPFLVAKALAEEQKNNRLLHDEEEPVEASTDRRGVLAGASVMVSTQFVMVAVMTMTPIYMGNHGFSLQAVGMVIGFHIAGMYLPSLVTGTLVEKAGRARMAAASAGTLLAAGVLAAVGPADSLVSITIALILLGLGWNFGLISGTTIVVDAASLSTRAKTQGTVDVWIAFSGAVGGGLSGIIVAYSSFGVLAIAAPVLSLLAIPVIRWAGVGRPPKTAEVK
nr:MFS transporter [Marinococcus luteus]